MAGDLLIAAEEGDVEAVGKCISQTFSSGGMAGGKEEAKQIDDADERGKTSMMAAACGAGHRWYGAGVGGQHYARILKMVWQCHQRCGTVKECLVSKDKHNGWNVLMYSAWCGDPNNLEIVLDMYKETFGSLSRMEDEIDWVCVDDKVKKIIANAVFNGNAAPISNFGNDNQMVRRTTRRTRGARQADRQQNQEGIRPTSKDRSGRSRSSQDSDVTITTANIASAPARDSTTALTLTSYVSGAQGAASVPRVPVDEKSSARSVPASVDPVSNHGNSSLSSGSLCAATDIVRANARDNDDREPLAEPAATAMVSNAADDNSTGTNGNNSGSNATATPPTSKNDQERTVQSNASAVAVKNDDEYDDDDDDTDTYSQATQPFPTHSEGDDQIPDGLRLCQQELKRSHDEIKRKDEEIKRLKEAVKVLAS